MSTQDRRWSRSIPGPRGPRSSEPARHPGWARVIRSNGEASATENIILVTAHCTVVAVDIEGFGRHSRNNINQVRVRHGMYQAMQYAFDNVGIPWDSCYREGRGDGMLMLAPAEVPKALFVDRMPDALVDALRKHNKIHPAEERMRLKLALHAGEINYDFHGVTGYAINHTCRLLDADVLKSALGESSAILAIIGSAWFFDEVIRQSEWSHARSYRPTVVTNKETNTLAWIRLLKGRSAGRPSALPSASP